MEDEKNIISSDAKLSAIAGVMFFAPFVKNRIRSEEFSEDEKNFIHGYIQIWFLNLIFLAIFLLVALANFLEPNIIFTRIMNIWSFAVYIISVFSMFACANELTMRGPDESINQKIQHKWQLLKAYTPIMNFIFWFRQENYNMPYRWLKESILLRTFFIFGTLLLWNLFGIGILAIIIIRIVLLMLNIDIIPLSIKKVINLSFLCNPWEIFAYIFAPIVSKIKKVDYQTALQTRKQWYAQWQKLWIWIILQYIVFISILYFIYRNSIDISLIQIVLLFATILWIVRILVFYAYKKAIPKIPILSEIISLVFH